MIKNKTKLSAVLLIGSAIIGVTNSEAKEEKDYNNVMKESLNSTSYKCI